MACMIVDVHTHVFPPRMIADRERLAALDAGFAELYASPHARMATADELLDSMTAAGVDRSVTAGFWWRSGTLAAEHRAYILDAAQRAAGRLVPFVTVGADEDAEDVIREAVAGGAAGLGEVRLEAGDVDPSPGLAAVLEAATASGLPLLVHCSEEVGHAYPGKAGGLTPGALWRLVTRLPHARVIAAHWGGGFPFYGLMPEVRAHIQAGTLVFDTAASSFLYDPHVFEVARGLAGDGNVLWGSDFPLRSQAADRASVEAALADETARDGVLGGNAAQFLGL